MPDCICMLIMFQVQPLRCCLDSEDTKLSVCNYVGAAYVLLTNKEVRKCMRPWVELKLRKLMCSWYVFLVSYS